MGRMTFTSPHPLKTAVLFLVFNRLDTTKQVFEAIRQAKPPRLYIAADGAREDKEGENQKVQAVRDFIMNNIDWECEVKTLFREKNLGCKMAVSGAITWFFENEEMGIILEDDCLPSQSFFWFCEELLKRYKDEERVMQVNGSCFLKKINIKEDYFFSKYNHIWGWATWQRAWKNFNLNYPDWETRFEKISLFNSVNERKYWEKIFKNYFLGYVDTWDYSWTFSVWINNGLSVYPKLNMIRNIGFAPNATHTFFDSIGASKLQIYELDINSIIGPENITLNKELDLKNFEIAFKSLPLYRRILNKLKKCFKKYL